MELTALAEAQRCESCRDHGPEDEGHENCGNHPRCKCYGCWPKKQQHVNLVRSGSRG